MRKTTYLVLAILLFGCVALAGMPRIFGRSDAVSNYMFPKAGDVDGLKPQSKAVKYREEKFKEFYGSNANIYLAYGVENLVTGNYTYGSSDDRVTIEMATMEDAMGAAGLFHYHRGSLLKGRGKALDVGAEGVVDVERDGRNLYFYRSNIFVKVLFSGKKVPSLLPIAQYIDSRIPKGRDDRPEGFELVKVAWADEKTISLTPGFCFSLSFLPPAVTASAPGAGGLASDLFIITRRTNGDAAELFKDYQSYLQTFSEYIEEIRRGKQRYVQALDPNQGRIIFTAYKNVFIIAARPDGYDKGEELIQQVMQKIDQERPKKR